MRYAALAVFLGFLTVFGFGCDFAPAFRFAAHRWRILSAAASRWAAENLRRFFFGAGAGAEVVTARGLFGGRPMRFVGP